MSADTPDPSPKVVCIEDDHNALDFIRLTLRDTGYTFIGISDPREALEVLKRHTPDVVVLDIMMPDMSGWDVFRHLQAEERLRHVPVIVVTARASQVDRIFGERVARVHAYLQKPFEAAHLRMAVRSALEAA
ncbi:MAG: response regulator [Anaerolineales bacterium]